MSFVPLPALGLRTKSHPLQPLHTPRRHYSAPCMTIPKSVTNSKVLIVGGGPAGSTAAAHLHKRHIPTTLIEKQSDFNQYDVTKAYCLRLDYRAVRVLSQVDGMFEHVSQDVDATEGMQMSVTDANGKKTKQDWPRRFEGLPDLCDLRPSVMESLKRFVTGLDGVDTRYGVTVKDIQVGDDGEMTVTMDSPDGEITHNTRLLLACDGRNSKVGRLLELTQTRGEAVEAPSGHGIESFDSPGVGLLLKSIVFDEDVIDDVVCERKVEEFRIRALTGDPKRGFEDVFRVSILPTSSEYRKRIGGVVGTVTRQDGHNIWKLGSVDEGYEFFQRNFPQLDARKAITEREMRRFVEAAPSQIGDIRRRRSLAVKTGKWGNGGVVVFLGDSAHAFPPDIGQGVSAALGDVGVFMDVLDSGGENDTVVDVGVRYDEVRSDEGKALMKISRFATPYQYMVYVNQGRLWLLNYLMRKLLSKAFPGVLWPPMASLLAEDINYREIVRRGDVTTARLFGGLAMAVALMGVIVML